MSMLPKLYVGGIQSGLRGVGRVGRRSRKQLGICISQPPLRVALRGRANDAATAREREGEDGHKPCDHYWSVKHLYLEEYGLCLGRPF